jgi:accessory gene regulator protein AgrB
MNEKQNPLRNYSLMTAHMMMQILAWMWSIVFALAFGSYVVFGITVIGHALILAAVFGTLAVFSRAEQQRGSKPLEA